MRPFTKTQGSGGKTASTFLLLMLQSPWGREVWHGWAPWGSGFISRSRLFDPTHPNPPPGSPSSEKSCETGKQLEEGRKGSFSFHCTCYWPKSLLPCTLDIESLCLNLEQWFSTKGQACARRTLKTLQRGGIQYTQAPNSLPLENQCM